MFCTSCGAQIVDGAAFCTSCGASQKPEAPLPNDDSSAGLYNSAEPAVAPEPAPVPAPASAAPKKKRTGLIVAIVIIVVVVVLAIAGIAACSLLKADDTPSNSASGITEQPSNEDADSHDLGDRPSAPAFSYWDDVTASSELPHDGTVNIYTYYATNACDGDLTTCWSENDSGDGAGEYLSFYSNRKQTFTGFDIWNGYQVDQRRFDINNRVANISVYADGVFVATYTLSDTMGSQSVLFDHPIEAYEIELMVESVYYGTTYNDCCITEVLFY